MMTINIEPKLSRTAENNRNLFNFLTHLSDLDARINQAAVKSITHCQERTVTAFYGNPLTCTNTFYKKFVDTCGLTDTEKKIKDSKHRMVATIADVEILLAKIKEPVKKSSVKRVVCNPSLSQQTSGIQLAHNSIALRDPLRSMLTLPPLPPLPTPTALSIDEENKARISLEMRNCRRGLIDKKEILFISEALFTELHNESILLSYYKKEIEDHVETRIYLFFQQLVACYDTQQEYEIRNTSRQFFSAPTLLVAIERGVETAYAEENVYEIKYNAAHPATLPALKSRPLASAPETNFEPFSSFTYLDDCQNSTHSVPKFVNDLDSALDKKRGEEGLRDYAIELINAVSKREISPFRAMKVFLNKYQSLLANLNTIGIQSEMVSIHKSVLTRIIPLANTNFRNEGSHPLYDQLMGENFKRNRNRDIPVLRNIVFRKKIKFIQTSLVYEKEINQIILSLCGPEATELEKQNVKLDLTFYAHTKNSESYRVLEKLFSLSVIGFVEAASYITLDHPEPWLQKNKAMATAIVERCRTRSLVYESAWQAILLIIERCRFSEREYQASILKSMRFQLRSRTSTYRKLLDLRIGTHILRKAMKHAEQEGSTQEQVLRMIDEAKAAIDESITLDYEDPHSGVEYDPVIIKILCRMIGVDYRHFMISFFATKY